MKLLRRWYEKRILNAAAMGIILAISILAVREVRLGPVAGPSAALSVIVRHYGIHSAEMERSITIPMEEALSAVAGIEEMRSSSEYGESRIDLILDAEAETDDVYLQVRAAVERAYAEFPESVQKPLIIASSRSRRPVFLVTYACERENGITVRELVEGSIKPSYENIEGVGEVEVYGGRHKEIHVEVDPKATSLKGISLADIAFWIQTQSTLSPAGLLSQSDKDLGVVYRGELADLKAVSDLGYRFPDGEIHPLSSFTDVKYGYREQESISRVDGKESILLSVQSSGTANQVSLSQRLRKETAKWDDLGFPGRILMDTGRELELSLHHTLRAIGYGMMTIAVFLSLSTGNLRRAAVLALSLPLIALVSTSILSVAKVNLDHYVLAIMAVGMGLVVDAGIIVTEGVCGSSGLSLPDRKPALPKATMRRIEGVLPPLAASSLTTAVAVVPLFYLGVSSPGVTPVGTREIAVCVVTLVGVSFFISVLFAPLLLSRRTGREEIGIQWGSSVFAVRVKRRLTKHFYVTVMAIQRKPLVFLAIGIALAIGAGLAAAFIGEDLQRGFRFDSVYAHMEFESGATVESVDRRCLLMYELLRHEQGICKVETTAHRDSAEMIVSFDPSMTSRDIISEKMQAAGRRLPAGYLYLPEGSHQESRQIEISIQGDDNRLLRDLAKGMAEQLRRQAWVDEVVLHFKQEAPVWRFLVDHDRRAASMISVGEIIRSLRWALYGPVALKMIEAGEERDLRVMALRSQVASIDDLLRLPVRSDGVRSGGASRLALAQVGDFEKDLEPPKIYRKDRQRVVYLTVHSQSFTLDALGSAAKAFLAGMNLPAGYSYRLGTDIRELERQRRSFVLAVVFAFLLIYMVMAAQSESFSAPVATLLTAPLSLSFPLLALWFLGFSITFPVLIGMIILTGIVVNNVILIIDKARRRLAENPTDQSARAVRSAVLRSLRNRLRPLLLTSGTTLLGVLPLLIMGESGTALLTALAFVVFWGIIGSLFTAMVLLPALTAVFPRLIALSAAAKAEGSKHAAR